MGNKRRKMAKPQNFFRKGVNDVMWYSKTEEEKKKMAKPEYFFRKGVNDLLSKIRSIPDEAMVKEVFLWELVLNAAQALIRGRKESLVDMTRYGDPQLPPFIHITSNKMCNTLSVSDSGIGMTRDDLVRKFRNIGPKRLEKYMETIDKYSKPDADVDLSCIYSEDSQRLGLGFYSTYMVADKVVITTHQAGHVERYVWAFDANANANAYGGSTFTVVADVSGHGPLMGTDVTVHLKEGYLKYTRALEVLELVNKFSKICPYPIFVWDESRGHIVYDYRKNENEVELEQWEDIRKLFVKFIADKAKNVDVVVSAHVFDLPCNLSVHGLSSTLEINPTHRDMEAIRKVFDAIPKDKALKYMILLQFHMCLNNFKRNDRKHGTSFYEEAKRTLSLREGFEMWKRKENKKMANKRRRLTKKRWAPKKFPFGTGVNNLLSKIRSIPDDAMVKEVFLWELVRNAARALYFARRESLVDKTWFGDPPVLYIHIAADKTNNTLSVFDSGIGMTRDDLVNKLGAIDSVSKLMKFERTIDEYSTPDPDDVDLSYYYSEDRLRTRVGFYSYMVAYVGLGFYSTYMVADKVVITTKQAGHDEQYVWEFDANANGGSTFTVAAAPGHTLFRGTQVTLHLKEGDLEYLEECKLMELVKKYSKYICPYPMFISILDENAKEKLISVYNPEEKEENEEEWEALKEQYKDVRELFVKFIPELAKKKKVDVVISDRVFDLPCNLSVDDHTSTLEINPRHRDMEEIREAFVANPEDKQLKYMVFLKFYFCLLNMEDYDERHGTTFYENAKKTLGIEDSDSYDGEDSASYDGEDIGEVSDSDDDAA